ncbi:ATP-dependent DNA helicase RecG [Allonocardiopsis opalescens]|uniref:ATP-dependent DNA helicase RecG n=1 Tax=Allonocardiopsis opalescens TaxID=1144618 RepID=UPI000D049699|nr:ATP-dependent DNA helicase RecG [Allonocardiopsis opalescens]
MDRRREPLSKTLGDRTAATLARTLDLHTLGDLLRHYPRRYARRGELTDLASLAVGDHVTVLAEVESAISRPMKQRRGRLLTVTVTDGRGRLSLTFFGRTAHYERELVPGRQALFAGKVSRYGGTRQLTHPEYELLDESVDASVAEEYAARPIPVYPSTASLPSWRIAKSVGVALDGLGELDDPLPAALRARQRLVGLAEAYEGVHRPHDDAQLARARRRLKWDEAFGVQVALAQRRLAAQALPARPRPPRPDGLLAAFDAALPFTLTEGQREVGAAIAADLGGEHPMHRLLQGDVGAGKTLVALRAMLQVVDAGGQAALLAPTEVLAQQHHRSITALLGPLAEGGMLGGAEQATRVTLLTGSQGAKTRRAALLEAASGDAGIVVGTHALLQENVQFADLGLVVVDEQHRFGVEQRDALREKAGTDRRPHVLVMTATPIPRTVAMTVFGDLDVIALTQLPAGRSPVATHVVPAADKPHFLRRAYERLAEEVGKGRQVYVVCPRIGGDEPDAPDEAGTGDGAADTDDAEAGPPRRPPLAVLDVAPMLAEGPLRGLRVAPLHGRMPPDEKESVMRRFAEGELDVLVATTVVEVGVDVPNASTMMIMDADRFGVSQLHQLRGRVGRGSVPGLCLLVTEAAEPSKARDRLAAVAATTDGFELSRVDLEQRREGDVLGAAQSGRRSSLRMLTLLRDEELIGDAREAAAELVAADPALERHPALADAVDELLGDDRAEYLEKA